MPLSEKEEEFRRKRAQDMTTQLHRKLNLRFKFGMGNPQPMMNLAQSLKEAHDEIDR